MEFVNRIIDLMTDSNHLYVRHLSEIIINNKFRSIDELKSYEDELFTIDGKLLDDEERINYCMSLLNPGYIDYEVLTYDEIKLYNELINNINDTSKSIDERIFDLVKVFELTKRNMYFVCEVYQYILDGRFDK